MPQVPYDHYLKFEELTQLLKGFADEHPDLVQLSEIGRSYEGRPIWLATVTDFSTGAAEDKPGFWCDGNIHASEVSACSAVMRILELLVTQRPEVLKTRVFYLVPRLGPDGAELALADRPRIVRSGTRSYPYPEEDLEGIEREDLDGDGRVLQMRVKDPNGPWVPSEEEPRLLRKRKPGERAEVAYRLLPEGLLHHWDGVTLRVRRNKEGLDFNRNFPNAWRPENEQYGAGPYPTSEPEIRAAVQAIVDRPNVCGAITFHTFSGVLLRPPSRMPDDEIPSEDLWTYQELGEVGHAMTGYPAVSNFHDFKYHPKEVITGVFDDWMYHSRGVHAWTVEIWSPQRQAGITDYKYIDWFRTHPFSDDVKMLQWSDEVLGGRGYVDWYAWTHPQLGEVELGGWDMQLAWRNPPLEFLEKEITPLAEWAIWHAGTTPCLALRETQTEDLGDSVRIRLVVENTGWLPTNVTQAAVKGQMCRGVRFEIACEGDATAVTERPEWLVAGTVRHQGPQLDGWSGTPSAGFGWHADDTSDRTYCEWVVKRGASYTVTAQHDRAGRVSVTVRA